MGDISAEPSMEDILSSIKRIIAEEGEAATSARQRRAPRATPREREPADSNILELSDPVAPEHDRVPEPRAVSTADQALPADAILSDRAAEVSRGALDTLSRLVVKPETDSPDTLEGLVRAMLRPMLAEWLDAKLPAMVEAMVAREIARITQGR